MHWNSEWTGRVGPRCQRSFCEAQCLRSSKLGGRVSLGCDVEGAFTWWFDEGLGLTHHKRVLPDDVRGTIAHANTLRPVRNIGNRILWWSWILVWAEAISWYMTTCQDVVISCGLYNFIIRDVCWARTGPDLIHYIFNHSEPRFRVALDNGVASKRLRSYLVL